MMFLYFENIKTNQSLKIDQFSLRQDQTKFLMKYCTKNVFLTIQIRNGPVLKKIENKIKIVVVVAFLGRRAINSDNSFFFCLSGM